MSAIYNEIDPFAAQWLRNLIAAGHIAPGAVDERSIKDLVAADVRGHGQRHFFAGIAGWSLALRLAGVPDGADVWTGSCPCQGLSSAGKQLGFADPRHLWPVWFGLIRECRPPIVFGEQVASALGWTWLDLVFADLEGAGYSCAASDLPACSVGAPHRRQRLFFVAYADRQSGRQSEPPRSGEASSVGNADGNAGRRPSRGVSGEEAADRRSLRSGSNGSRTPGLDGSMADASSSGWREGDDGGQTAAQRGRGPTHDSWSNCDWIPCSDGVSRPVEPGTHPLAHGVPARVGKLRAYGNAFVPEVGAAFIRAASEAA